MPNPPNIAVSTTTYSNGSDFNPQGTSVASGSSVTLTASSGTIAVYTYMKDSNGAWQSKDVFMTNSSPYNATSTGKTYTLKNTITGMVKISLSNPPEPGLEDDGVNGTINVGGTNGDPE